VYEECMVDLIRMFIIESGFYPYDQIHLFNGKIDFVGIRDRECMVIESKIGKWKEAIKQVTRYGKGADYCYVALPHSTAEYCYNNHRDHFEKKSIGLLSVKINKEMHVEILINGQKQTQSIIFKKYIMKQVENRRKNSHNRVEYFIDKINKHVGGGMSE